MPHTGRLTAIDVPLLNETLDYIMKANCCRTTRESAKRVSLGAAILAVLLAGCSCGRASKPDEPAAAGAGFPFADRLGWFQNSCFAFSGPKLAGNTPVTLVVMGEPQRVEMARIGEQTTSSDKCPALLPGRAERNAKPPASFYALETKSVHPTDMGIGIVASPAEPEIVNGVARIDLDRDGKKEVFASCATSEGIKFSVWTEKPYQGEPRWLSYYYLGYDQQPNCP